ncbi:MAG: RNA methyltransferase [Burkholderiaceae bacterium]
MKIDSITSRHNPLLVRLRKLSNDSLAYRKQGQIWLEGEHLCGAFAARGAAIAQAVITQAAWEQGPCRELAMRADAVSVVPEPLMATLSSLESSPALAFAVAWPGMSEMQAGVASVVLDRVQDAGNAGAILRSAAAFGFSQVLALKGSAGLWAPKVLRAAMGAHFSLRLVESLEESALVDLRIPLLAAGPHAAQALHNVDLPWPCAWLFGHEGQGVSAPLLRQCQHVLRIAQPGGQESLNVAAAAAVCMYESTRQAMARGLPQRAQNPCRR